MAEKHVAVCDCCGAEAPFDGHADDVGWIYPQRWLMVADAPRWTQGRPDKSRLYCTWACLALDAAKCVGEYSQPMG